MHISEDAFDDLPDGYRFEEARDRELARILPHASVPTSSRSRFTLESAGLSMRTIIVHRVAASRSWIGRPTRSRLGPMAHPCVLRVSRAATRLHLAPYIRAWQRRFVSPFTRHAVLACYATTAGIGFYAAILTVGWMVMGMSRRICRSPHEVGETVMILHGPFTGRKTTIGEITRGQGGQPAPRVDLGLDAEGACGDVFDEYCLLRLSPRSQDRG